MTAVVAIALAVGLALLVAEAKWGAVRLARLIARLGARRLPAGYRGRYAEEFESEVMALHERPLAALAFAVRIACTAGRVRRVLSDTEAIPPRTPQVGYHFDDGVPMWVSRIRRRQLRSEAPQLLGIEARLPVPVAEGVCTLAAEVLGAGRRYHDDGLPVDIRVGLFADRIRVDIRDRSAAIALAGPFWRTAPNVWLDPHLGLPPVPEEQDQKAGSQLDAIADRWGVSAWNGSVWFEIDLVPDAA